MGLRSTPVICESGCCSPSMKLEGDGERARNPYQSRLPILLCQYIYQGPDQRSKWVPYTVLNGVRSSRNTGVGLLLFHQLEGVAGRPIHTESLLFFLYATISYKIEVEFLLTLSSGSRYSSPLDMPPR